jgi:hypothetical protein
MGVRLLGACAAVVLAAAAGVLAAVPGAAAQAPATGMQPIGQLRLDGCPEGDGLFATKVAVSGTRAYVLGQCIPDSTRHTPGDALVFVVDAADPERPRVQGSIRFPRTETYELAVSGDYAYVTTGMNSTYTNFLLVIDATDPASPRLASSKQEGAYQYGLAAQGRYVYLGGYRASTIPGVAMFGLAVVDASDPTRPTTVGQARWTDAEGGLPRRVVVEGSRAYVYTGQTHAIDVSDATQPRELGRYRPVTAPFAYGMAARNALVYFAGVTSGTGLGPGRSTVWVVDFSDPTLPRELSSPTVERIDGYAQSLALGGSHAFVPVVGPQGMYALDVSDPTSPRVAGLRSLHSGGHVAVAGEILHVAANPYLVLRFPATVWRTVLPWVSQSGSP